MATRRGPDGLRFDHGAQFFTARDPRFAACVEDWTATRRRGPGDARPDDRDGPVPAQFRRSCLPTAP
jgi:hypothetical protein